MHCFISSEVVYDEVILMMESMELMHHWAYIGIHLNKLRTY